MLMQMKFREALTLIESEVTDALPTRRLDEARSKAKLERVVGGFKFDDPLAIEDKVAEAKKAHSYRFAEYFKNRDSLERKLQSMDVKPLAMVPSSYWNEITKRHGLVTVSPNLEGRISINHMRSYVIGEKAGHIFDKVSVISCSMAILSGMVAVFGLVNGVFDKYTVVSLAFFTAVAIASVLIKPRVVERKLKEYLSTCSRYDLLKTLTDAPFGQSTSLATLRLPNPPDDVITMLRKLWKANQRFEVTAEPAALLLEPSPEKLFMNGYVAEVKAIREARDADPIITISRNGVTAVLAQFGDFKWERAVIEDVIWSKPLPALDQNY
jgi:hypothetical protein